MSIQAVRQEIVAAVDTIEDLRGFEHPPPVSAWVYGAAWPLWNGMVAAEDGYRIDAVALHTWRLLVVLGPAANPDAAMDGMDRLLSSGVLTALAPVGFVESVTPAVLPSSAGEFLGAEITLRRE